MWLQTFIVCYDALRYKSCSRGSMIWLSRTRAKVLSVMENINLWLMRDCRFLSFVKVKYRGLICLRGSTPSIQIAWKSSISSCSISTPPVLYTSAAMAPDPGAFTQWSWLLAFSASCKQEYQVQYKCRNCGKKVMSSWWLMDDSEIIDVFCPSAHRSLICLLLSHLHQRGIRIQCAEGCRLLLRHDKITFQSCWMAYLWIYFLFFSLLLCVWSYNYTDTL